MPGPRFVDIPVPARRRVPVVPSTDRILIVGAGMAGLRTAEALRAAGSASEIVVIGAEEYLPYNRPPLSKDLLRGQPAHAAVAFPLRSVIDDVHWRLGCKVVSADLAARRVNCSDGTEIGYRWLVVASGVRARLLPGTEARADCPPLRTLDDCRNIRARLDAGGTVAVIGGGFIGCEVAASLAAAGRDVVVIEPDQEPMSGALGSGIGAALRRRHELAGVRFRLGSPVTGVSGDSGAPVVHTADGEQLRASLVIQALGSIPNTSWLGGNGLDLTDGVLAGPDLVVLGTANVVAVGDIVRFPNPLFDDVPRRVEHWQMAITTARRAAASVAGSAPRTDFAPIPWFWSDQGEVRLQAFGTPSLGEQMDIVEGRESGDLIARYVTDGLVTGAVLIGSASRARHYREEIGKAA